MKKQILVAGSIAYDHLFLFARVFQDELMVDSKEPISVAFNVKDKKIHFGGCAGNIAYNGKLLGENFAVFGIVGKNFAPYGDWLKKNGVETKYIVVDHESFTSEANVMTDQKQQQITIFHEGAAAKAKLHQAQIKKTFEELRDEISFAIISPNSRDFIMACLSECHELKIPYFFDPGQAMPVFSKNELIHIVNAASGIFLNEYELTLMEKQLGLGLGEILHLCPLVIVTQGERGATIYYHDKKIKIPTKRIKNPLDPTGCGDAFRAGFLTEIKSYYPKLTLEILERAGNLGTKLALACLRNVGTQNHDL